MKQPDSGSEEHDLGPEYRPAGQAKESDRKSGTNETQWWFVDRHHPVSIECGKEQRPEVMCSGQVGRRIVGVAEAVQVQSPETDNQRCGNEQRSCSSSCELHYPAHVGDPKFRNRRNCHRITGGASYSTPVYSKCIGSGSRNEPPQAKPCRRNTSMTRGSMFEGPP